MSTPVPPGCQNLADEVSDLVTAVAAATIAEEEAVGSAQKAAVGNQRRLAERRLATKRAELSRCIANPPPPTPTPTPPPPPPQPFLRVTGMQVVQSIQTPDNRIRLVRDKQASVRAFVVSGVTSGFDAGGGPNRWPDVTGELRVTDTESGVTRAGPILPFNPGGSITAVSETELDEDNESHSLNFRVPAVALFRNAAVTVSARVFVNGHGINEFGWSTQATRTVTPLSCWDLEVTPFLLEDVQGGLPAPSFDDFLRVLRRGALSRWPIQSFRVNAPITLKVTSDLTTRGGWNQMLVEVESVSLSGSADIQMRAGLVRAASSHALAGICSRGGSRVVVRPGPLFFVIRSFVSSVGRGSAIDEPVIAHEMGHFFGLDHSVCSGTEDKPHDIRLPGRTDATAMHRETAIVIPRGSAEIMSSCGPPRWPSIAAYDVLFDRLRR